MEISRNDQIKFAKEILALESDITDQRQLVHLQNLVSLLIAWTNPHNDIATLLSEYIYEVAAIAKGEEDTGWKDEFKKKLYMEMEDGEPSDS